MKKFLASAILLCLLLGCTDPYSASVKRADINANAAVEAARIQANATMHAADQETVRTALWAGVVPWALLIVGAVVLAGMFVVWSGRIHMRRLELTAQQPPSIGQRSRQLPAADTTTLAQLKRLAARDGYSVVAEGDVAYLLDSSGQPIGQRLLTGG